MSYSVKELSEMSGVSVRTLHWYDKTGLLVPVRNSQNGYRVYTKAEVDRLQDILYFKELGLELSEIKDMLCTNVTERYSLLQGYRQRLLQKQNRISCLLESVDKTIMSLEGQYFMNNKEKFEAFKEKLIEENEQKYGKEARERYGKEAVDGSNELIRQMGEQKFAEMQALGEEIISLLREGLKNSISSQSPMAAEIAQKHKEWLMYTWKQYTKEAHCGLAEMYAADERFTQYYDTAAGKGAALLLKNAICENV